MKKNLLLFLFILNVTVAKAMVWTMEERYAETREEAQERLNRWNDDVQRRRDEQAAIQAANQSNNQIRRGSYDDSGSSSDDSEKRIKEAKKQVKRSSAPEARQDNMADCKQKLKKKKWHKKVEFLQACINCHRDNKVTYRYHCSSTRYWNCNYCSHPNDSVEELKRLGVI